MAATAFEAKHGLTVLTLAGNTNEIVILGAAGELLASGSVLSDFVLGSSIAATEIAFGDGANSITGSSDLLWDDVTKRITIQGEMRVTYDNTRINDAVTIGPMTSVWTVGQNSVAIGADASAEALGTISIGTGSTSDTTGSIAIGRWATTSAVAGAVAIGQDAASSGIAIGYQVTASGTRSIFLGDNGGVLAQDSIGVGSDAYVATGATGAIAIGANSGIALNATYAVAIGETAGASLTGGIAIGHNANAAGSQAIAIGENSDALGTTTIALGVEANVAASTNALCIGYRAGRPGGVVRTGSGVLIGANADPGAAANVVGIGTNVVANGSSSTAIGVSAQATSDFTVAIGRFAQAGSFGAIAIGGIDVLTAKTAGIGQTNSDSGYTYASTRYITDFFIGGGSTSTTCEALTIRGSNASGTDIAGGALTLQPGRGTGSAEGGYFSIATSTAGGSGSALNSAVERLRVYSNGGVQIGGTYTSGFGAGTLFVNSTIYGGGLTIAGAVDNPSYVASFIAQWSGGATSTENSAIFANPSILALTGNKTGTVGLASIRTSINTNAALTSSVTVTGLAGWYEKGNLGFALGVGGALAITNYYGGYVANLPALASGVTITNQYGLYIETPTRGGTLNRAIHVVGGDSYFGGTVTLASLTGTATSIVGTDSGGVATTVTVGSGLTLSGGTLSYSGGATLGGSIATDQVAYGTGVNTIGGSFGITFDSTNRRLGVSDTTISQFAPSTTLHLSKNANTGLRADTYSNTAAATAGVQLYKARGTAAAPSAVQSGDTLGFFGVYGYGATAFSSTSRANIQAVAAQTWTDAAQGTNLLFYATDTGSTTPQLAMTLTGANGTSTPRVSIGTIATSIPSFNNNELQVLAAGGGSNNSFAAIMGRSETTGNQGTRVGVYGLGFRSTGTLGADQKIYGVLGVGSPASASTTGQVVGVYGYTNGSSLAGTLTNGLADTNLPSPARIGVAAVSVAASTTANYGVYAVASGGATNYAGYFQGETYINGKLTVTGLIDPTGMQFTPVAANPGTAETIWVNSGDANALYYGASKVLTGSGNVTIATNQVAYGTGTDTIGGDNGFTWDLTRVEMIAGLAVTASAGSLTPSAGEIHASNKVAVIGATENIEISAIIGGYQLVAVGSGWNSYLSFDGTTTTLQRNSAAVQLTNTDLTTNVPLSGITATLTSTTPVILTLNRNPSMVQTFVSIMSQDNSANRTELWFDFSDASWGVYDNANGVNRLIDQRQSAADSWLQWGYGERPTFVTAVTDGGVFIGHDQTFDESGGQNFYSWIALGNDHTVTNSSSGNGPYDGLVIGMHTLSGGNASDAFGVQIGSYSEMFGYNNVLIGQYATIGTNATNGSTSNVLIGYASSIGAGVGGNIVLGVYASSDYSACIVIGNDLSPSTNNQAIIGSYGGGIREMVIGNGLENTLTYDLTIRGSNQFGTDKTANDIIIYGGRGTGSGKGGETEIRSYRAGTTGTALNTTYISWKVGDPAISTFIAGAYDTSGIAQFYVLDAAVVSFAQHLYSAGSATAPAISFLGDLNTGFYSPAADQVSCTTGGTQRWFTTSSLTQFSQRTLTYSNISGTGAVAAAQTFGQWTGTPGSVEVASLWNEPTFQGLTASTTGGVVNISANRARLMTTATLATAGIVVGGAAGFYDYADFSVAPTAPGTLTITNYYGTYLRNPVAPGANVTVTNQYGLYIDTPTRGGTLNRAIHVAGGNSYFGGTVTLASLTGTATSVVGVDSGGVATTVTLGSGLSLSSGTLSASAALTATYIGYGDGTNSLTGNADFVWDNTNKYQTIRNADNTNTTKTHIRLTRGTGALNPFEIQTKGDTGNGVAMVNFQVQGAVLLQLVGTGTPYIISYITTAATAANTAALVLSGGLGIANNLWLGKELTVDGMAAPAVSASGKGRIYFDSTANKFKVSEHGAAYVDLVGGGTPGGSDTQVQFNDGGVFGASAELAWNKTTKALTVAGSSNVTGSLVSGAYSYNSVVASRAVASATGVQNAYTTTLTYDTQTTNLASTRGYHASMTLSGSNAAAATSTSWTGMYAQLFNNRTAGSIGSIYGFQTDTEGGGVGGTTNYIYGGIINASSVAGHTTTEIGGLSIDCNVNGTSTSVYGLYINIRGSGTVTNKYGIYQDGGTALNVFESSLSIANTTATTSVSTGSFYTTGGIGIAKGLWLGNELTVDGMAAPAVSAAGKGRIYFDSTANRFLISENGGAYVYLKEVDFTQNTFIEAPTNKTYTIVERMSKAGTIVRLAAKLASGTCTANIQINGVSVTSLSAVAVTSTQSVTSATGANTLAVGDRVTVVITSASSPVDLALSLEITEP